MLTFIERNWRLRPITHRSRVNLPNPIGDLLEMFDFGRGEGRGHHHDPDRD